MANKKADKKQTMILEKGTLPQNIVLIGEQAPEDKRVYIYQKAYKQIHKFTQDKTKVESGGVLLGRTETEFGKTNIIIVGFVEAKYTEATATTLTFTHKTWEHIHSEAEKQYPGEKILGWIHTHPDYGIFLSEYDKFIQSNFFSGEDQIAQVVDPIQKIEGFYVWINGNIERCKGYYVFDATDIPITLEPSKEEGTKKEEGDKPKTNEDKRSTITIVFFSFCFALIFILCMTMLGMINSLKTDIERINALYAGLEYRIRDASIRSLNLESEYNELREEMNQLRNAEYLTSEVLDDRSSTLTGDAELLPQSELRLDQEKSTLLHTEEISDNSNDGQGDNQ